MARDLHTLVVAGPRSQAAGLGELLVALRPGARCTKVGTVEKALRTASARRQDLVLVDVSAGRDADFQALARMTDADVGCVIAVAGPRGGERHARKATAAGAAAILTAPYGRVAMQIALSLAEGEPAQLNALIVDDSRTQRTILRRILEALDVGCVVEEACDGVDGLEHFRRGACDLVLLDVNMPRLGGVDVLRAIRDSGSHADVVMLSADDVSQIVDQCEALGVSGFILKPLQPGRVAAAVHALTDIAAPSVDA
ncbi:MAG: response regulator [Caulobacterales bacterium]|nr:response regulator [Caulobacterales bacterium]